MAEGPCNIEEELTTDDFDAVAFVNKRLTDSTMLSEVLRMIHRIEAKSNSATEALYSKLFSGGRVK